ncbi:MAG: 30S ribosome-binding factor RbfA [Bdellovibrionales bacterium]|nr:30S ribosome-binding factor RbfA [Bdellovibrionales bacterium]
MKNTGDGRRVARVEREVQQSVAQFLISGFKLPLPGIVTVARVRMPGDLRTAKVYISILGDPKLLDEAVDLLQDRAFEIQNYLGKELKMRYCPKLTFYPDHETEEILKVEKILQDLDNERKSKSKQGVARPEAADSSDEDDSSEEG